MDNGAKALLDRIEQSSIMDHYSLLGDGNIRPYDWERVEARLAGNQRGLWRFFLLGQGLSEAEAAELLGQTALDFLLRHKLCRAVKGKLSMGTVRLVSYCGGRFFVERGTSVSAYLGEDVKALMAIMPRMYQGRCLCLYPAGAVEVWPLAATPELELDFAEIKTRPEILQANLELNFAATTRRVVRSFGARDAKYDLIVSNVPSYFQPPGVKLPKHAAGGSDGLKCLRRALALAKKMLTEEGEAVMTFVFFAAPDSRDMEARLSTLLKPFGLDYSIVVSSKLLMEPGVPIFNHLVSLAEISHPDELDSVMKKTLRHGVKKHFGAVYLIRGRFWKSAKPIMQRITNYSDTYYGTWTI
ncbi:MAG: hypothetical protein WCS94_11845 [Verrucomicrobiota bacterium]